MMEPYFSPRMEAYISVLDKIKNFRLKRGLFPAEYTKQVNLEIAGIRKRLMAAAHRARHAEAVLDMCEKDPKFAARWKWVKLESAYINTIKRRRKLEEQLVAIQSDQSVESDPSDNSGGGHAGQN